MPEWIRTWRSTAGCEDFADNCKSAAWIVAKTPARSAARSGVSETCGTRYPSTRAPEYPSTRVPEDLSTRSPLLLAVVFRFVGSHPETCLRFIQGEMAMRRSA